MNRIRTALKNNTGSSLVIVIVAIAFVGILGATIMWMSLNNYFMKTTDAKHKESFYAAETVLEQVVAGVQKEASDAIETSYRNVLQNYSSMTESERGERFRVNYLNLVQDGLKGAADDEYDIEKLKGYVDSNLLNDPVRRRSLTGTGKMTKYDTYIVLEGLQLEFEDDEGYMSIITTDLKVSMPEIDFTQSSSMPDIFDFCIVANQSLVSKMAGGEKANVNGCIYGGEEGIVLTGDWTIQKADMVVTDAAIVLDAQNAKLTIGNEDEDDVPMVWAENLVINYGEATLNAKTYIADDMTIGGNGVKATLKQEYYGYGNSLSEANKSSAIVVNGLNSTLDMSELNKLLIAGHSYIGTSKAVSEEAQALHPNPEYANNADILMGESIAVKGNQIAYLVPDECIGVVDGVTKVGKNPLNAAEYEALQESVTKEAGFTEVSMTKTLTDTGLPLNAYATGFKKVFCPVNNDTLVYYYLVMSEDGANAYFENYYGLNKEKLDRYFDIYSKGITVNSDFARINVQGNWMTSADVTTSEDISKLHQPLPEDAITLGAENVHFTDMFEALKTKLIINYYEINDTEKAKSVFENIIDTKKLDNYMLGKPETVKAELGGFKAIITKKSEYEYNSADGTRLIIATGDVKVSANFTGLIIAKGKVYVEKGVIINSADNTEDGKSELTNVLQCPITDVTATEETRPIDFFMNSGEYVLDGTEIVTDPEEEETEVPVDFATLVSYMNWVKK